MSDQKSVRALFHLFDFPDRIIQTGDLAQAFCHPADPALIEHQTVNEPLRHMVFPCLLNILCICIQDLAPVLFQISRCL